ncbi:MAG TPA: hypothetical protein EYP34_14740 [Chromatiaceae bacterium]|nr:hypothetical protein [Chromatiaceae bacterium]
MLKRAVVAIYKLFFNDRRDKESTQATAATSAGRRQFFAKATLGAASVSGAAGLARMAVDSVPKPKLKDLYAKDAQRGEQEMTEREYVVMSEQEKTKMLQMYIDNYDNKH